MKYIVYGVVSILLITLILISVMTIEGHTSRSNDMNTTVSKSVDEAVNNLKSSQKYSINNVDEFVADFNQLILDDLNVGTDEKADPNLEVTVSVANVDYEKGLMMLVVETQYTDPNNKVSKVRKESMVILDKEKAKEHYTLTYYLNGMVYKEYELEEESDFIIPEVPGVKNWKDLNTNDVAVFPDKVDKDYQFEAIL